MKYEEENAARLLPWNLIRTSMSLLDKLAFHLARLKMDPNFLTTAGFVAGAAAGILFALELPAAAAAAVALSGIFDILDGQVAKRSHRSSLFGAVYDSSMDRYTEFFMLAGLAWHFRHGWGLWLAGLSFLGSTMVSYVRARSEAVGIRCKVGIMQRAERLVLLMVGTIAGLILRLFDPIIIGVLAFMALVSNLTALQRLFHVRAESKKRASLEV